MNPTRYLDPRAWLLWLAATMLPVLMGRNPFPLLAVLLVVLAVRSAWGRLLTDGESWDGLGKLLVVIAIISVVFNLLTAPYGNQVITQLPKWWPLGDVMTLNALVYGLVTALAIATLILAATTAGLLIDWPTMLRLLPARLLTLAVAASVAWAFIPQTLASFRDIREAQKVRGARLGGPRSWAPFVVPLLASGLDRATTLAEALEARGFGGAVVRPEANQQRFGKRIAPLMVAMALTLATLTAYCLIVGLGPAALLAGLGAMMAAAIALRMSGHEQDRRTRYRNRRWQRQDTIVSTAAASSLVITGISQAINRDALFYEPYPDITVPTVSLPLLAGLALLLAPILVAPLPEAAPQHTKRPAAGAVKEATPLARRRVRPRPWWARPSRPWAAYETRWRGPVPPRARPPVSTRPERPKRAA